MKSLTKELTLRFGNTIRVAPTPDLDPEMVCTFNVFFRGTDAVAESNADEFITSKDGYHKTRVDLRNVRCNIDPGFMPTHYDDESVSF